MKIGIYCTNNYSFPLPNDVIYASIDVAVSEANALVDLGHEITLFAPIGTKTKANLVTFDMLPYSDPAIHQKYPDSNSSYEYENIMMAKSLNYIEDNNFDIFQTHCRPFSIINFAPLKPKVNVVSTVHDPLTSPAYKILPLFNQFKNLHLITLTKSQQKFAPEVSWAGHVYNGIDLDFWKFKNEKGKYLLYCGRVMPEKGADLAVQIAIKSGIPLKIMGNPNHAYKGFYDEKIAPFLSDKIEFLGSVSRQEQIGIYQDALALLAPIRWAEPFGLVMIEANASGVPVIAANQGSVPEIINPGRNGFIVDDSENIDSYVEAINKLDSISRNNCRLNAEENFSTQKMAESYLKIYETLIS